jgi:hypothetical protein
MNFFLLLGAAWYAYTASQASVLHSMLVYGGVSVMLSLALLLRMVNRYRAAKYAGRRRLWRAPRIGRFAARFSGR